MKNIKLLINTLLFSSLLMGCGMKGPLYRTPVAQPTPAPSMEKSETEQDNATTATTEEQTNSAENTTATDKQQAVAEQGKSEKTTASE